MYVEVRLHINGSAEKLVLSQLYGAGHNGLQYEIKPNAGHADDFLNRTSLTRLIFNAVNSGTASVYKVNSISPEYVHHLRHTLNFHGIFLHSVLLNMGQVACSVILLKGLPVTLVNALQLAGQDFMEDVFAVCIAGDSALLL